MKLSAFGKDIRREFRRSLSRFLSITIIICLGVGFFIGMKATAPTMIRSAQVYFNNHNTMDIKLLSLVGFSDEDAQAVRQTEGVRQVTPSRSMDALIATSQNPLFRAAKIMALPGEGDANQIVLESGRMPESERECVICKCDSDGVRFAIGDVLTLDESAGIAPEEIAATDSDVAATASSTDALMADEAKIAHDTYTVVGIVSSPLYISYSYGSTSIGDGSLHFFLYVLPQELLSSVYTELYVNLDIDYDQVTLFDDNYELFLSDAVSSLDALGRERMALRVEELSQQMDDTYQQEADNAQEQLDDAQAELDDAKQQLNSAQKQIQDGWAEYNAKYAEYQSKIAEGEAQLSALKAQVLEAKIAAATIPSSGSSSLEYLFAQSQVAMLEAQAESGRQELEAAKKEYEALFAETRAKLESAEREYAAGQVQYAEGVDQFNDAKAEVDEKLNDAAAQIRAMKQTFDEVSYEKWYVFDRNDAIPNYSGIKEDADRIDSLSILFPAFFLVVAVLVCMTTMTRMVEEQRGQMGAYRALGYSARQIFRKYLLYSLSAGIVGGVIGEVVCVNLFPGIIMEAYYLLHYFPDVITVFPWKMGIIGLLAGLTCTGLVTYICCRRELHASTAALMRPKAPKAGRRIWLEKQKIWQHFSFSTKITIRNLMRYKVRFLMTVIGIAGCTALIMAGFGLKGSVLPIIDRQYNRLVQYDFVLSVFDGYSADSVEDCRTQVLENSSLNLEKLLFIQQSEISAANVSGSATVTENCYIFVPDDAAMLDSMIHLYRDNKHDDIVPLTDDGVVITDKMARDLDLSAGDTLVVTYQENEYPLTVTGIAENYLYHYVYMTADAFAQMTGDTPTYNAIMGTTADGLVDSEALLASDENFLTTTLTSDMRSLMVKGLGGLNLVILVLILSASALAVVVVYNLTNINISERIREIATAKVLGFTQKESNMYIFRENIIMTAVGLVFGCLGGYVLTQFIIGMVETDMVAFVRDIPLRAYLYSCAITIGTTLIVMLLMHRRIKNINMVEALKSVE